MGRHRNGTLIEMKAFEEAGCGQKFHVLYFCMELLDVITRVLRMIQKSVQSVFTLWLCKLKCLRRREATDHRG